MEQVLEKLEELGIDEQSLPESMQSKVDMLDGMIEEMNQDIDSLEKEGFSQEDIEEKLEAKNDRINAFEEKLVEEIDEWHKRRATPAPQKSNSGWGWAIFGGLALVLTLGAVNVMQKN